MKLSRSFIKSADQEDLEETLGSAFNGAPDLPSGVKRLLATAMPFLAVAFAIMQLVVAFTLWVLFTSETDIGEYKKYYINQPDIMNSSQRMVTIVGAVVLVLSAIMLFKAYGGLKARTRSGWHLAFLATMLYITYAVVSGIVNENGVRSILFGLFGFVFALYLLFQIRDLYKVTQPKDEE